MGSAIHKYDRIAANRKLWAIVNDLKKVGIDGSELKKQFTSEISNGKTESSSRLSDAQHLRLIDLVSDAAKKAGIEYQKKETAKKNGRSKLIANQTIYFGANVTNSQIWLIIEFLKMLKWSDEATKKWLKNSFKNWTVKDRYVASNAINGLKKVSVDQLSIFDKCQQLLDEKKVSGGEIHLCMDTMEKIMESRNHSAVPAKSVRAIWMIYNREYSQKAGKCDD